MMSMFKPNFNDREIGHSLQMTSLLNSQFLQYQSPFSHASMDPFETDVFMVDFLRRYVSTKCLSDIWNTSTEDAVCDARPTEKIPEPKIHRQVRRHDVSLPGDLTSSDA